MIEARSIKGTMGYALARTCKGHRSSVGESLAKLGLHVGQEMILMELWQDDGLRGGELARRLGVEPPTITKMLRRLEGCGFVERRPDPEDARSFRVHLTGKGRSLEEPVARCWRAAEEKTLSGMSPEERRELHRLLTKARANLDPTFAGE